MLQYSFISSKLGHTKFMCHFFLFWTENIIPENTFNPENFLIMRETIPGMMVPFRSVHAKLLQSCLFATPWTVARQAPLSMGFSKQEY